MLISSIGIYLTYNNGLLESDKWTRFANAIGIILCIIPVLSHYSFIDANVAVPMSITLFTAFIFCYYQKLKINQ